jgi:hypothetical protein
MPYIAGVDLTESMLYLPKVTAIHSIQKISASNEK